MSTTIDLADYVDDPITVELTALLHLIDEWSPQMLEDVAQTLDDLTLVCATRAAAEHREAGRYLALIRRVLRAAVNFEPGS